MTITLVTDERLHQEVASLLSGVSFYGTSQRWSHSPSSLSLPPFASDDAFLCVYSPSNSWGFLPVSFITTKRPSYPSHGWGQCECIFPPDSLLSIPPFFNLNRGSGAGHQKKRLGQTTSGLSEALSIYA